jgi:hypothetical protein
MHDFNAAVARWYQRRFGVDLDPGEEVVTLIGSKEGIAHIPLAFIDPGDVALVASPGYPVYHIGTQFAGGEPYFMDLLKENGFLPDLKVISEEIAQKAKMMFINYPNNPTAAVATKDFFESVVAFAAEYNVIVCHDAAYSEMAFDGYRPTSFLEVQGAKSVGIEFHSLSKTYCISGRSDCRNHGPRRRPGMRGGDEADVRGATGYLGGRPSLRGFLNRKTACHILFVGRGATGVHVSRICQPAFDRSRHCDYARKRIWCSR